MKSGRFVRVDGRTFIVDFDDAGEPLRIKERKKYGAYPLDGWYNAPYWHAKHHVLGGPNTLPVRILAAARADQPTSPYRCSARRARPAPAPSGP